MSEETVNEYRRPDGTLLVRWLGDGTCGFGGFPFRMTPVGIVEFWRDGVLVAEGEWPDLR